MGLKLEKSMTELGITFKIRRNPHPPKNLKNNWILCKKIFLDCAIIWKFLTLIKKTYFFKKLDFETSGLKIPLASYSGKVTQQHRMVEGGKFNTLRQRFTRDAARIWNRSPEEIKNAKTLMGAKKEIKKFCKTLPI